MTLDTFTQIWISLVGLPALGCMMVGGRGWSRAGVVLGVIGQPAWWIQLFIQEQWGMSPVYVGYSLCWVLGIWNHWIKPAKPVSRV